MRHYIDLHLHSTASDGTCPPAALMRLAAEAHIATLALTDHDTTSGIAEAAAEAERLGMEFIPGCELSGSSEYGQVDVIGLWVPWGDAAFEAKLAELRQARTRRNLVILDKLRALGMPLNFLENHTNNSHERPNNTDVTGADTTDANTTAAAGFDLTGQKSATGLNSAGLNALGRPHIALQMLRQGYVKSVREAFDRYLGEGCPAFVPKEYFSPEEAVQFLSNSGAVSVLAHPMLISAPADWLEDLTLRLKPLGLDALEAYHSEHSPRAVRRVLELAQKHNFLLSGGSDYHGSSKPWVGLGRGRGGMRVPPDILPLLKERLLEKRVR